MWQEKKTVEAKGFEISTFCSTHIRFGVVRFESMALMFHYIFNMLNFARHQNPADAYLVCTRKPYKCTPR